MKAPLPSLSLALLAASTLFAGSIFSNARAATPVPDEFKDPDTGARILKLSKIANPSACVIYFTQKCITPDSRYALVRYMDLQAGHTAGYLYRYDFKTGELVKLSDVLTKNQDMAPGSGNIYYTTGGPESDQAVGVTNIYTKATRIVAKMPDGTAITGATVNADESLVVGTGNPREQAKPSPKTGDPAVALNHGPAFTDTFARHDTNLLLSVDIKSGEVKELHRINTWLGHPQFSPTDPKLVMYCHEGPWAEVDRIWLYRFGGDGKPTLVLKRTEPQEIAGHEFWSADGKYSFFDHNYRDASHRDYVEGKSVADGSTIQYPVKAPFGSIHYAQSPDGKFFICDGGTRPNPKDQAMYALVADAQNNFNPIKLCSMATNNYKDAEPNPHLTPDQHWAIFTATFDGTSQAYAVEMPKQFWR